MSNALLLDTDVASYLSSKKQAVHANHPRDEVKKKLADERITFPVLIDDGKTAERIGIGFSACLLVDREGKVLSVYKDSLAPPAQIEKLLEEESDEQ
ncbi:MAG TPA: hypothetical protein VNH11_24285 [Pirellulales bacterium]|nr:hypothetical protein [Pirellulales bacterium]